MYHYNGWMNKKTENCDKTARFCGQSAQPSLHHIRQALYWVRAEWQIYGNMGDCLTLSQNWDPILLFMGCL